MSDQKLASKALTVRRLDKDYSLVIQFLEAGVRAQDLQACFEFMLSLGNPEDDHNSITFLLQSGVNSEDLNTVFSFVNARDDAKVDLEIVFYLL